MGIINLNPERLIDTISAAKVALRMKLRDKFKLQAISYLVRSNSALADTSGACMCIQKTSSHIYTLPDCWL